MNLTIVYRCQLKYVCHFPSPHYSIYCIFSSYYILNICAKAFLQFFKLLRYTYDITLVSGILDDLVFLHIVTGSPQYIYLTSIIVQFFLVISYKIYSLSNFQIMQYCINCSYHAAMYITSP